MANTPAILAEGLHKSYGEIHALDGLDLVAEEGSVLVVLPAPLGPRTPRTLPSSATRSSPSRAWISPSDLLSPSARIAGVFAIGHLLLHNLILLRAKNSIRNDIVSITGKSITDIFMKRNSIVSNFRENGKA